MSSETGSCELSAVSLEDSDLEPESEPRRDRSGGDLVNGDSSAEILSVDSVNSLLANGSPNSGTSTEAHSGLKASALDCGVAATNGGSAGAGLCADHGSELDWFCKSEGKLICSHCAIVGSCNGHTVTPVVRRAADVRVSE